MIFALDIGTRKVAGILGERAGDKIRIIDCAVLEHEKRAMIDGQIHSVEDVSKTVMAVKRRLEEACGVPITSAVTALAGRSLRTSAAEVTVDFKGSVGPEQKGETELKAVKAALDRFLAENIRDYTCVGYSPAFYEVDGQRIKDPLHQEVKERFRCGVIATFLPDSVFNSMLAVLKNCGLALDALTLEPIAAINVTIPEDMRMLNLALVDVGAGTSDIAVVEKGRITGYGMIPKAGDEITEEICSKFLMDFKNGEKVKREIDPVRGGSALDIFGNPVEIGGADFEEAVAEAVNDMASDIADAILSLNNKQPQAVVMAGGGSSLVLLKRAIAAKLGLPESRVASRLPANNPVFLNVPAEISGADGITPAGILETAAFNRGLGFVKVSVNNVSHYSVNMNSIIRVADVLASRGVELRSLYGRPGEAVSYTLNGTFGVLRGGRGEHAKISVNGREAGLEDQVKDGDSITMAPPVNGRNAAALLGEVVPGSMTLTISVNNETIKVPPVVFLNGREADLSDPIPDRAVIEARPRSTAREALAFKGFSFGGAEERDIIVTLSGEPAVLKQRNYTLRINGAQAEPSSRIKELDKLEFEDKPSFYRIKDLLKRSAKKSMKLFINNREYEVERESFEIYMNGKKASEDEFLINGASIEIKNGSGDFLLNQIFKYFQIDMESVRGKMVEFKVDGEKAGYTTPLKDGSRVEIRFY